jgi:hypothetical protein
LFLQVSLTELLNILYKKFTWHNPFQTDWSDYYF